MLALLLACHIGLAALAGLLFLWRGIRSFQGRPVRNLLWRRIVPDSVDSLLLLSGLAMAVLLSVNPLHQHWLLVKLLAVLLYIGLGWMALHDYGNLRLQRAAFVAALLDFGYIVALAHGHAS